MRGLVDLSDTKLMLEATEACSITSRAYRGSLSKSRLLTMLVEVATGPASG